MNMKRSRIVQIVRSANYGGVESHVLDIVKKCIEQGASVSLISLTKTPVNDNFCRLGIPIICLKDSESMSMKSLMNIIPLANLLHNIKPHIIHLHGTRPAFFGTIAARLVGVNNIITTIHSSQNLMAYGADGTTSAKLLLVNNIINLMDYALSTDIIAVSNSIKNEYLSLCKHLPKILYDKAELKIHVIHNWVETGRYKENTPFASGNFYTTIGTISRLDEPKKGLIFLLKAVRKLKNEGFGVKLVIAGDGYSRKSLEKFVAESALESTISFYGYCDDIPTFLKDIDIFVLPSLSEGFPIVNLEAMASCLPVISSDVGGVSEAICDNLTGILVEPGSEDAIADKIKYVINNKDTAIKMGKIASNSVKEFFDIEINTSKIIKMYEKILK